MYVLYCTNVLYVCIVGIFIIIIYLLLLLFRPPAYLNVSLILILITAVLYSAPSRKSTQELSQSNLGQTMWC